VVVQGQLHGSRDLMARNTTSTSVPEMIPSNKRLNLHVLLVLRRCGARRVRKSQT